MERHRGDRYYGGGAGKKDYGNNYNSNNNQDSYYNRRNRPSRFSEGPINRYDSDDNGSNQESYQFNRGRSPENFRRSGEGEGGGSQRAFDRSPRLPPAGGVGGGGGFRPPSGGVEFRPMGGNFGSNFPVAPPQLPQISGQKRGFSGRGGNSPDRFDGGTFAKLFVGSVPKTATEEDIRPLFEAHGRVVEVALIKDKRTGQQQGCCFIKYATSEEADRAIRALHNNHTLPGGIGPIQVRYADGERERLGAVEYKLFVGSLNKGATEKEIEEIFAPYGQVEDVYIMRDDLKQSRGCGFVKYAHKDMAMAAINALSGVYVMRGCDQPLTVRFADPKRPRPGESRSAPAFGGPGYGPRFQPPGPRPPPNFSDPMGDRVPQNAWDPMSPQNLGPSSSPGIRGFGSQFHPRSGDLGMPSNSGGLGVSVPGLGVPPTSSTPQQSFNQPPQFPSLGPQISPLQRPLHSPQQMPPSLQPHPLPPTSYSQPNITNQTPPFSQPVPSQPLIGQTQVHQIASSGQSQTPLTINLPSNSLSNATNQQQLRPPVQQQPNQPSQQSPSQLAQMLSQQTQTLQASFQSSQQAFSQLQQQLQLMQPSHQNLSMQQTSQPTKQQWAGIAPQTVSAPAATQAADVSVSAAASAITQTIAPLKCNWTEHSSPDGYKYYYNCTTGESKWEKPEELTLFEQQQQQQKPPLQQPQGQAHAQNLPTQQLPVQLRPQLHQQQQLQQQPFSSLYPTSGVRGQYSSQELGYTQLSVAAGSVNDPARFQQGLQATQEWMWKNKPSGT